MASTHLVVVDGDTAIKTYRSWDREEPKREWTALGLLDEYAYGLSARPLELSVETNPPFTVMSRVPGEPLGAEPLSSAQIEALAASMWDLHQRVPESVVIDLPPRLFHPAGAVRYLREVMPRIGPVSPTVDHALAMGYAWVGSPNADRLGTAESRAVLGQADGNLANALWDGREIRLVDFEDSGRSDRAWEIAGLLEHPSSWLRDVLDADTFLNASGASRPLRKRITLSLNPPFRVWRVWRGQREMSF